MREEREERLIFHFCLSLHEQTKNQNISFPALSPPFSEKTSHKTRKSRKSNEIETRLLEKPDVQSRKHKNLPKNSAFFINSFSLGGDAFLISCFFINKQTHNI